MGRIALIRLMTAVLAVLSVPSFAVPSYACGLFMHRSVLDSVAEVRMLRRDAQQAGTGFVWDRLGHVVTNHHVVDGAAYIGIRFPYDVERPAHLVAASSAYDLAILQVDGPVPKPVWHGEARRAFVGETVVAVGNSNGNGLEMLSGPIRGFDQIVISRTGTTQHGLLAVGIPLRSGQSGGPLFNCAGQVIGVNSLVVRAGAYGNPTSVGFAIPVERVRAVVDRLLAAAYPGVSSYGPRLGVRVVPDDTGSLRVAQVYPNTPAAWAGAQPGDLITHANGFSVADSRQLAAQVNGAGQVPLRLRIVRFGTVFDLFIPLKHGG